MLLASSLASHAQSAYQIGTLPAININKDLKKDWSVNFKWESRQSNVKSDPSSDVDYEYILSDFSLLVSNKVGLNSSIACGYLIRIIEDQIIHRSIQQVTIIKKYNSFRLAHRFSSDQTFDTNDPI